MPASIPAIPADEAIRATGLRATQSRRLVYEELQGRPHASADDIYTAVHPRLASISFQTVYNVLGDFADAGLVRRIEPAGLPMLFELRVGDNHHHLVCTRCGAIEDVDCAVGHAPCLMPTRDHSFQVNAAEVTFWGLCGSCAASDTSQPPTEGNP